jgi:hypothetical protein
MRQNDDKSKPESAAPTELLAGVGAGGLVVTATEREPYEALDDLMNVIEALCPTWPSRRMFSETGKFLM